MLHKFGTSRMRGHQRADELSTCLIVVALTDLFRGILSYSLINIDLLLTEIEHIYSVAMATAQPIPTRPIPENMFLGVLNVCARIQLPKSILREKVISPCQKVHF